MTEQFKGAIFDMDGTLLDSMPVWDGLSGRFLAPYGVRVTAADYAAIEGTTQLQGAQYFVDKYPALPMDACELVRRLDRLIDERYGLLARPKEGVRPFLARLRDAGVAMAVATLTTRCHAEKALRTHGLAEFFACVLTIDDVGVSKRQPDIYLRAAQHMGLTEKDCIVFEDAPYAARTAKDAGFRVCGLKEPAYAADEAVLRQASDFFIEHSYDELDDVL